MYINIQPFCKKCNSDSKITGCTFPCNNYIVNLTEYMKTGKCPEFKDKTKMIYQLIKRYYDNNNILDGEEIVIESDDELWIYDQKDLLNEISLISLEERCEFVVRKVGDD